MQRSDWARPDSLSVDQQSYAAADVAIPCLTYRVCEGLVTTAEIVTKSVPAAETTCKSPVIIASVHTHENM